MDTPITYFRRLFEFEQDAHAKVVASLRAAERTHAAAPDFQAAVDIAAHVIAARRMWLWRLGAVATPPQGGPFPKGVRVEDLAAAFDDMQAAWSRWLAEATNESLAQVIEFRSPAGTGFRTTVHDGLTQLFHHSAYHRGQVALLVRRVGAEPAPTDFIYWSREPL